MPKEKKKTNIIQYFIFENKYLFNSSMYLKS